ncbi:hypothetical protein SAMN02927921_04172 [Sinomicrobium oceani]|uniref:Inner membrane protein YedI n=1 Tax=Sinomicrobium oceani TaxID=1150368 RepID=A0A1K1RXP8_9FLAO|nr:DUF808 family protein [Sinomicrobium oceani]SFW76923.1 hypothetical protein SAMN02927921_04172 [Sinomicrobium oceani]
MASGIFAVLDDIAALMDDIAVTSKVATRKTAAILGDDLAVNAEKATGFLSSRELPVLWAITKGSFVNKLIIIPVVLALNAFFPVAVTIMLLVGGCYLAYEGMEKIVEFLFHRHKKPHEVIAEKEKKGPEAEKAKIKSAIVTDFILSIEIVIIALSTVQHRNLTVQAITVTLVAFIATIGVYGIVALIVRMDDAGFKLVRRSGDKGFFSWLGNLLIKALPVIIRLLGVIGTIALILVSGGIFIHHIDALHHLLPGLPVLVRELVFGVIAGIVMVLIVGGVKKLLALFRKK